MTTQIKVGATYEVINTIYGNALCTKEDAVFNKGYKSDVVKVLSTTVILCNVFNEEFEFDLTDFIQNTKLSK